MMRGQSYGITNFVSRPFASLATIVVEYTRHPLFLVLPLTLVAQMSIDLIREVDFENGWATTTGSKEVFDGKVGQGDSALRLEDDDEYQAVAEGHIDETAAAFVNKVWGEGEIVKVNDKNDAEKGGEKERFDDDYTHAQ